MTDSEARSVVELARVRGLSCTSVVSPLFGDWDVWFYTLTGSSATFHSFEDARRYVEGHGG